MFTGFPEHWTTLKKLLFMVGSGMAAGASAIWKTVTGTLIHITDALASPMQKCEVSLEPIQAGSGDPSPDNVRPITGWTGVDACIGGDNLFTIQGRSIYDQGSKNPSDTIDLSTPMIIGGAQVNGIIIPSNVPSNIVIGNNNSITAKVTSSWYGVGFNVPVMPNTQYTVGQTIPAGKGNLRKSFYTAESKFISYTDQPTFTTPPNCHYLILVVAGGTVGMELDVSYIRLMVGSADVGYSDYVGNNILSVEFPALGKNLFDKAKYQNLKTDFEYVEMGYYSKVIPLLPNTAYTVSFNAGTESSVILLINNNRQLNSSGYIDFRNSSGSKTFTTDETGNLYIGVYVTAKDTTTNERIEACKIQIEKGSSATSYEPYTNTIFGGYYDPVSGKLSAKWVGVVFDGVSKKINVASASYIGDTTTRGYFVNSPYKSIDGVSQITDFIKCNSAKPISSIQEQGVQSCYIGQGSTEINLRILNSLTGITSEDTTASAKTKLNAYLAQNPITFVYKLSAPIIYQLDPIAIQSLAEQNNIWSNTNGNTTVIYKAQAE